MKRKTIVLLAVLTVIEFVLAVWNFIIGEYDVTAMCLLVMAAWLMAVRWAKDAYIQGYGQARMEFYTSAVEATKRGITPWEWAESQMEKDAAWLADSP